MVCIVRPSLGIVAGLCVVWLKFHVITHRKISVARRVEIGTGSRILTPGTLFQIQFWGHISATNKDIFTKYVVFVGRK